jgi:hypothetical protein
VQQIVHVANSAAAEMFEKYAFHFVVIVVCHSIAMVQLLLHQMEFPISHELIACEKEPVVWMVTAVVVVAILSSSVAMVHLNSLRNHFERSFVEDWRYCCSCWCCVS